MQKHVRRITVQSIRHCVIPHTPIQSLFTVKEEHLNRRPQSVLHEQTWSLIASGWRLTTWPEGCPKGAVPSSHVLYGIALHPPTTTHTHNPLNI